MISLIIFWYSCVRGGEGEGCSFPETLRVCRNVDGYSGKLICQARSSSRTDATGGKLEEESCWTEEAT